MQTEYKVRRKTGWGEIGEEIPTGGEMEIDRPQVNTCLLLPKFAKKNLFKKDCFCF